MSLINKLLKELDQRRHINRSSAGRTVASKGMRAVSEGESVWVQLGRGSYLLFLVALIAGAGVSLWFLNDMADKAYEEQVAKTHKPVGDRVARTEVMTMPPVQVAKVGTATKKPTPKPAAKVRHKPKTATPAKTQAKAKVKPKPKTGHQSAPSRPSSKKPMVTVAAQQDDSLQNTRKMAQTAYERGLDLLKQGRVAEAEQAFARAVEILPVHVDARSALGGLMMDGARWQQAADVFRAGLALDKKPVPYSLGLARSLVEQGDVSEALGVLEDRDDGKVRHGEFLALLAALYQRQNEHRDAVEVYRRALVIQPYEGRWWMGLGISLEHRQAWAEAQTAYENALKDRQFGRQLAKFVGQRLGRVRQHLPVTLVNDS